MALILAINPEGRQTATLVQLARELQGHELMGADSCAIAMTAVDRRVPDLVLLPPAPEKGQAELLSHLLSVPGGVRTLTLPPSSSDMAETSRSFAEQIRRCLASGPGRPLLVGAGFAVVSWIRARRSTWTEAPPLPVAALAPAVAAAPPPDRAPRTIVVSAPEEAAIEDADDDDDEPIAQPAPELAGPSLGSRAVDAMHEWREPITQWLPRLAALGAVLALAAVAYSYLPTFYGAVMNGVVVLETGPPGSEVFIDGRPAGTTPTSAALPAGPHTIYFRNGTMTRTAQIVVVARGRQVQRVDWMTGPTGNLRVNSTPSGARVRVDDVIRGNTPLTVEGLSLGSHVVTIESAEGTVRRSVTIAERRVAELNESITSGTLAVFAPFEIEVSEKNVPIRLDERDRTVLSPGTHEIRFKNSALGYDEVRAVEIKPAETTTLNLVPRTTLTVTASEPAEVSVDGARVGDTPLTNARINIGTRSIVVKSSAGAERRFSVTATPKPIQLEVDFSRP